MVDRDDDLCIGIKTSAITLGRADVPVIMACYALTLLVWAAVMVGRISNIIIVATLAAAGAQAAWHYTLIRGRSREGCFHAFRLNHWFGFAVFAGTALGYTLMH
ncbi:MAG: UbiA family prenyltransferase, partial [Burkholderiales bacterium]